jgi:hypothetical protein
MVGEVKQQREFSIDPGMMYRSDELSARMGWRPSGWRAARRAGLKAYRYGKRWFVIGSDVIAFVIKNANEEEADGR